MLSVPPKVIYHVPSLVDRTLRVARDVLLTGGAGLHRAGSPGQARRWGVGRCVLARLRCRHCPAATLATGAADTVASDAAARDSGRGRPGHSRRPVHMARWTPDSRTADDYFRAGA